MPFPWLSASFIPRHCLAQSGSPPTPEANPGRPTVSTPATLTPVGYLQFENGVLYAGESSEFVSRFGVNQVTKLFVLRRLELILQSEPFVRSLVNFQHSMHEGEVFLGAQGVVLQGHDSRPAISLSYFRRVHQSVATEVDIGTFEQSALILVSDDLFGFHVDANGIVAQQREGLVRRAQFGQTLSISHPIKKFTVSGEIWHFTQPFLHGNTVGNLWAFSCTLRKNLVVDTGFNRGFMSTSTRWEVFAGFTYLLPHRMWKDHRAQRD